MDSHSSTTGRALRALAAALTLGITLAFAAVAQAAPQYDMTCIVCHQMPPLDSATAKKNPYTGAIPGNHQGHASSQVASCAVCHEAGVLGYNSAHRNKAIELSDGLNYSRKVGGFLNQTSVPPNPLGTCSTAACHSNGKGSLTLTPAWGSPAFSAPGDCSMCHGAAPTTGSHPVSGSKHGAYFGTDTGSCAQCHGDHLAEAKPFAHATSAGRAIDVRFAGGGSFAGNSCSTVYCHSNGKGTFSSPTWGAALDCSGCHGTATVDGPAALSGKHAIHVNNAGVLGTNYGCVECHSATVSDNSTIADTSKHTDGSIVVAGAKTGTVVAGSCATSYCHSDGKGTQKGVTWGQVGTLDCKGCHGSDAAPAFASIAGEPNYVNAGQDQPRANSHQNHVTGADSCVNCHSTTTTDGLTILAGAPHTNNSINLVAGNGKSFDVAGNTCSNVSCHSGNGIIAGVAPAKWGASLGCVGCHGDSSTLATNAHAKHVTEKGYACDTCHAATVSGSSTIVSAALHGNSAVNVSGAAITFTEATNTCATACHLSSTPDWTNSATGACGSCHAALSTTGGVISSNAHDAHFTASYGPAMDAANSTSCAVCHVYTTPTHVNSTVNLAAGYSANGTCVNCHKQTTDWTSAGRISCESCHSTAGGQLSVIGGLTAPDKTLAASAGHGKAGVDQNCQACHDNSGSHISGVAGDNKRLLGALTGPVNQECNFCHQDGGKVSGAALGVKAHQAAGLGSNCADCHNPHGTANNMMVNASINGTAVSFTGNDTLANESRTGVCQVCHTTTEYFTKAGEPQATHVDSTTNCLDCHAHNPQTGLAFMANGACDACHGYPPAPRVTNTAVTFGVQGNWSSARFEDYSGGGGAHVVAAHIPKGAKASDGWVNCLPCHNGGAAAHARALPLRNHVDNVTVQVDPQFRFSDDAFISYTTAQLVNGGANRTGTCFNVSCHFRPSPQWSIER